VRSIESSPTSGTLERQRSLAPQSRTASAVHLNNWIDDGSKEGQRLSIAGSTDLWIMISPEIKENPI
jgi:hypothetical protein